jgi:hypothetical protein
MPRWITTLIGAAAVALAAWVVARNFEPPRGLGHDPSPQPSASADAGPAPVASSVAAAGTASAAGDDGGLLLLSDLLLDERNDTGVGSRMPDGGAVPPLPMGVPRQVRFGVVFVSYAGAQPSALTGKSAPRSKQEAKALADRLYETAKTDFHAAVQQGDAGSSDDIGRVKLGVLEAAPQYVLFTLPVDSVGGPVDTPRGYWVVKRLE